jgi:hypothetical protein
MASSLPSTDAVNFFVVLSKKPIVVWYQPPRHLPVQLRIGKNTARMNYVSRL